MKTLIFSFTALALSVPAALSAQQVQEPQEQGQMVCCHKDKDGKMQCPAMDHSQMGSGQMDHGQKRGEEMTYGAPGDHSEMKHCDMMGGNSDKPATGHDGHDPHQGADDHSHHQGHTPQ